MTSESRQSLAFLLCVEAGPLEQQAILLARSIRRWAGAYADAPIHAFRLRAGPPLGPVTYDALRELGVTVHEEVLNRDHHDYVHANTTYAMVWAEDHLDADVIVWADSDKVFLSEPADFDLPSDMLAAGTTPYYRGRATGPKSAGPGDPFDPYWERLYELAGVTEEPYVTALIDGRRLRAFWNGGLIVFRREARLAHEWLELLTRLLEDHVPASGILNVDQLSLAAVLARRPDAVRELDRRYNHNLALRALLPEPERSLELADLVSVHYHSWFNRERFLEDLRPPLAPDGDRYRWLLQYLPLEPTNDNPLPTPRRRRPLARRARRRWRRLRRRMRRTG